MMINVALFPIPDCVAFPGTILPLHVFEPRYRAMVKYCTENAMLMGVCHTQKILRPSKESQTVDERLNSNQATYKPQPIFSAGICELVETLDDGRLLIHVHMQSRFTYVQEVQSLPFIICQCENYEDMALDQYESEQLAQAKEKILRRLAVITRKNPEAAALVGSADWQGKDPLAFSFSLFHALNFSPELQQTILEMKSPLDRLHKALELINRV